MQQAWTLHFTSLSLAAFSVHYWSMFFPLPSPLRKVCMPGEGGGGRGQFMAACVHEKGEHRGGAAWSGHFSRAGCSFCHFAICSCWSCNTGSRYWPQIDITNTCCLMSVPLVVLLVCLGFRYELYCVARQHKTTQCVVSYTWVFFILILIQALQCVQLPSCHVLFVSVLLCSFYHYFVFSHCCMAWPALAGCMPW